MTDVETGTVAAVFGRLATVEMPGGLLACTAMGSLLADEGALAVGDLVQVETSGDTGIVRGRLPRRNELVRPPAHPTKPSRVLAANVDLLVVVVALAEPPLSLGLLDRALCASRHSRIPVALCVNKIDQLRPVGDDDPFAPYRKLDLHYLEVSAHTGEGVDALRALCAGRIVVLAGPSGVGKSSLAGCLVPGLDLKVQAVNAVTGKGRHTTSTAVMIPMPGGGRLIDTPGVRSFGLAGVGADGLRRLYPEFAPYEPRCQFNDCAHDDEAGCAVERAVERGRVDAGRYERYLAIRESLLEGLG